jgi:hypothetical protein
MLSKDKLLDLLKIRFDYYAAQAVFADVVSSLGLKDVADLGAAELEKVAGYLAEKVPGTGRIVEQLKGLLGGAAPAKAPAEEPAPAAGEEAAPAAEEAAAEEGAEEAKPKKKPKK